MAVFPVSVNESAMVLTDAEERPEAVLTNVLVVKAENEKKTMEQFPPSVDSVVLTLSVNEHLQKDAEKTKLDLPIVEAIQAESAIVKKIAGNYYLVNLICFSKNIINISSINDKKEFFYFIFRK